MFTVSQVYQLNLMKLKNQFSKINFYNDDTPDYHEDLRIKNNKIYNLETISINDLFEKYKVQKVLIIYQLTQKGPNLKY